MIALFAEAPALPLHAAGKYVAGAYIVFLLVVLIYVGIMAMRLTRNQKELSELRALVERREQGGDVAAVPAQKPAPADSAQGASSDPAAAKASEPVA